MPASHPSSNAPTAKSPHRRSIQWTFRTLSLVMGLLLLGLGNAAMALQRGDRGNDVMALQTRLTELGCYNSEIIPLFGPSTEKGVKLCQTQFGIPADGIVGPQTMAALNGNSSPRQNSSQQWSPAQPSNREILLQKGDRGENVTQLQQRLQSLGYAVGGVDGVYGEMTAAAVRDFQQSHGLNPSDGKVGSSEVAKLESSSQSFTAQPPAQPSNTVISLGTLTPGTENSDVTRLQQRLKDFNYFQGNTTQYYGTETKRAVTQFQQNNGIRPTGVADAQTLQALGLRGGVASLPPAIPYASSGAFNTSSFTNNRPYDRPATPNARYVVVIPKESGDTLGRVRQLVGSAQAYSSNKGDYIAAGSFAKRSDAEKRSQNLRAYGLDARVDYQ
jgi:peptidoglycan hydrolase-like protein with peptidoglycan-binding domain